MKILHVEDYFDPSAGYQINELLYASKYFDDEVFLITSNDMSPFHKKVDALSDAKFQNETGVKIYRLNACLKVSSRLILKNFTKTVSLINPDMVFMHGIGDFKDLQLYRKKPNYIMIRDCHMSWVASKNKFRYIFYLCFRMFFANIINRTNKYEKIFALGDEEYEYLKKIGINSDKIDFLRHGYNELIMYYDQNERREIREQYGFDEKDIVISYIGKFNYSKRPDLIFDTINFLSEEYISNNNIKLLFIGSKDKRYMDEFYKKMSDMQSKIKTILDDSKPFGELRKYYSASDICIFPKETTLSSIHAQVCGCPVIMENHRSNEERVLDSNNLFPIDDLARAAYILRRIIDYNEYDKDKNKNNKYNLGDREYKKQVNKIREIFLGGII